MPSWKDLVQDTMKYSMCGILRDAAEHTVHAPKHQLYRDLCKVGHNSLHPEAAHSAQTTAIQRYDR